MTDKLLAAIVAAILASFIWRLAAASPGSLCEHNRECAARELCVADTPTSFTGSCVVLRVLP